MTETSKSNVSSVAAGPDSLIDRTLLFGNPERTQGRISPDGTKISFIAPLDGVLNVWVGPAEDVTAAKPITKDTGRGIRAHYWAPNSTHVMYIKDTGGDEDFHLYSVNPESGDVKDLTPFDKTTVQVIQVSRDYPDEMLIGLNNRDPQWHDPYRVNVVTGKLDLIEQNDGFAGYVADFDLQLRLATKSRPEGGFDVLRREGRNWTPFFTIPQVDALTTNPVSFNAGNDAVYIVDSRGRDTAALVLMDAKSGKTTVLGSNPKADVSDILIDAVSREVVAYAANFMRNEWTALNDTTGKDLAFLKNNVGGDFQVLSQTQDGRRWIVYSEKPDVPGAYFLYDRDGPKAEKLFATRPALENQPLTNMKPVLISARDGRELVSYLSLPRWTDRDGDGIPAAPLPMVLFVHGGPWARDQYGYDGYAQWLSNRGYAVLAVNYRGSTGFGKDFLNAGDREWAGKMHDDLLDAVKWAIDRRVTTPDQVAIMGGSYGGYATLVGLTFTPDTFACGVDIVGPSNLETLLSTIPPYWASFFEEFATRVGDPRTEEGIELLRSRSPLHKAGNISRPLLIAQGANDPRVKQPESDQIVNAMKEKGLPVTYVLFPDEGHGFARPENSLAFNAIAEAFLAQCLGGRHEPIGEALLGSSVQVLEGADGVPGLSAALEGFEPVVAK